MAGDIAERVSVEAGPDKLPLCVDLDGTLVRTDTLHEQFLRAEKARGRTLVLATASDRAVAEPIAAHLGIFDQTLGSDGVHNLKGRAKAERLSELFGRGQFSYAGNSHADVPVWKDAGEVILVNAPRSIDAEMARAGAVAHRFGTKRSSKLRLLLRATRVYQWVKNVLVFI